MGGPNWAAVLISAFISAVVTKKFMDLFLAQKSCGIVQKAAVWILYSGFCVYAEGAGRPGDGYLACIRVVLLTVLAFFGYQGKAKQKICLSIFVCTVWFLGESLVERGFANSGIQPWIAESVLSKMGMLVIGYVLEFFLKAQQDGRQSENMKLQKKNQIYEQQLALCIQEARRKEDSMLLIKRFRHDIRKHLVCLKGYLEEDAVQEGKRYIDSLLEQHLGLEQAVSKSGNIIVDALLNDQGRTAIEAGIYFKAAVSIPPGMGFKPGDLCVILGNLLDNGLEAAQNVKEGKKEVYTALNYKKGILSIEVKNTYDGTVLTGKNGKIISSKRDSRNHGLGLEIVRQTAAEYDGEVLTRWDKSLFCVKVMLYEH